ncbi:MAG: hypothetical protein ACOYL3_03780 [Desulfuromonadaceae bacterium]
MNSSSPAAQAPEATKVTQAVKNIQVDISRLAQKLASDGDTQAQEAKESGAEKSSEKARGKA